MVMNQLVCIVIYGHTYVHVHISYLNNNLLKILLPSGRFRETVAPFSYHHVYVCCSYTMDCQICTPEASVLQA